MRFVQHYSGSLGNLYTVENSQGQRLIIDPGVSWKKIQKALSYKLTNVIGCLLTHEHGDHSKAIKDVIKAEIPCYMSIGTAQALGIECERLVEFIKHGVLYEIDSFRVNPYTILHDASDPLCFVICDMADQEWMLFVTDTCNITYRFANAFDIIAIECSYRSETLQSMVDSQSINEGTAKRLLTSHMEKRNAMRYIKEFCDLDQCREIHLLHMSESNIDKEATVQEFRDEFLIDVIIV